MTPRKFLLPRLIGKRFEDRALPLEFLKDLAVLEEMIVEVAKAEFFKDHKGRRRSPRGFTEGIELRLTAIETGSTIPVICLFAAQTGLFPPDSVRYFERARDAVVEAIGAAESGGRITDALPEPTLGYFDRLGRSLRDGEAIEFTTPTRPMPARLTRESRRRLVLASQVREVTEEVSLRGSIPEADQDKLQFHLQTRDGRRVEAPIPRQHFQIILEAFAGYTAGTRVLVQGVGRYDRKERLQGFDSVEHVSLLDPLDVASRLDEFRDLGDGWLEGRGVAPSGEGLSWLAGAFEQRYPDELQFPYLYPTEAGGVQAEWSLGEDEISLEIDLAEHTGEWHALHVGTSESCQDPETRRLQLDDPGVWDWLIGEIRRRAETPA
jgi:hypothetical protein